MNATLTRREADTQPIPELWWQMAYHSHCRTLTGGPHSPSPPPTESHETLSRPCNSSRSLDPQGWQLTSAEHDATDEGEHRGVSCSPECDRDPEIGRPHGDQECHHSKARDERPREPSQGNEGQALLRHEAERQDRAKKLSGNRGPGRSENPEPRDEENVQDQVQYG